MAIHTFVQWAFGFSYILFVATAARDQIDYILFKSNFVTVKSSSGATIRLRQNTDCTTENVNV